LLIFRTLNSSLTWKVFDIDRNFQRSSNAGTQFYGRARGGRSRGPADEVPSARQGTRTLSQSQQIPKLLAQSADQNLSDVGNEEWETASESSDVLAHHHTHDSKPDESKSAAGCDAAKGDTKKTFGTYQADRGHRNNQSEPRSGGLNADVRNGPLRSSSSGNGRLNQRGSSRSSAASVADAANR